VSTPDTDRERGAVLVELAVVVPLLLLLVVGTIELGSAWSQRLKVETAARAGARVGSSLGTDRLADYNLLQSVRAAVTSLGTDRIRHVVVYKSTTSDGAVPPTCRTSPPTSQTGLCNVYTGADLTGLTPSAFTGTTTCGATAPDRFWCPTARQKVQHLGTDFLGVWIVADSPTVTRLFTVPLDLGARAEMRLEPA
jgi:hypothetical protein